MELELTSDQEFFVETTRKFLVDAASPPALRELRDSPDGFDRAYWRQGAELGWTSLLVGEEDGGGSISGAGIRDLALVAFEFGRHAAPGPLLPCNVVAGALSRFGSDEHKTNELQGLISGELVATWAHAEPRPHNALGTVELRSTTTGAGIRLDGTKTLVEAGGQADLFLVSARGDDGLTQVLVPADAEGITIIPMHGLDLTKRFAEVTFTGTEVASSAVVGTAGGADADLETQLLLALVMLTAEMVGSMDRALEITVEWAFDRYTFGRPLASYQEIKHRFADMKMWLEASHALSDVVAAGVQDGASYAAEQASAAKAYIGKYGPELAHDCVQIHGGIGVTFDHDLHLYLRRVVLGAVQYGTVADHRERLTAILEARENAA